MPLGQVLMMQVEGRKKAEHYLNGLAVASQMTLECCRRVTSETGRSRIRSISEDELSPEIAVSIQRLGAVGRMKEVQNSVHRAVMQR